MAKSHPSKPLHHALIAERAHSYRCNMTAEEAALWRVLRRNQLGVRFVKQRVIGPYICDFAAPAVRLVVEVDGGYHEQREAADKRRDEKLGRWGWHVLRVSARRVMRELPAVVAEIERALRG